MEEHHRKSKWFEHKYVYITCVKHILSFYILSYTSSYLLINISSRQQKEALSPSWCYDARDHRRFCDYNDCESKKGKMDFAHYELSHIPYFISKLLPYLATYLQQIAMLFYVVMLNVSFDSLVYGFTIHACGQMELICHRLKDNFKSSQALREEFWTSIIEECIRRHILVQVLVKKVEALFVWAVVILFFFSLIILCTIFLISKVLLLRFFIVSLKSNIFVSFTSYI